MNSKPMTLDELNELIEMRNAKEAQKINSPEIDGEVFEFKSTLFDYLAQEKKRNVTFVCNNEFTREIERHVQENEHVKTLREFLLIYDFKLYEIRTVVNEITKTNQDVLRCYGTGLDKGSLYSMKSEPTLLVSIDNVPSLQHNTPLLERFDGDVNHEYLTVFKRFSSAGINSTSIVTGSDWNRIVPILKDYMRKGK